MHREEKTTKAKKIAFFACRIAEKVVHLQNEHELLNN